MEEGPLFSVIVMSVIGIFVYITIKISENRKEDQKNNNDLINNSFEAQIKLSDFVKSNKTYSEAAIEKKKKEILKNP